MCSGMVAAAADRRTDEPAGGMEPTRSAAGGPFHAAVPALSTRRLIAAGSFPPTTGRPGIRPGPSDPTAHAERPQPALALPGAVKPLPVTGELSRPRSRMMGDRKATGEGGVLHLASAGIVLAILLALAALVLAIRLPRRRRRVRPALAGAAVHELVRTARIQIARRRAPPDPALAPLLEGDLSAITAHFQPKVRLADGTVVGAELLARWEHPDGRPRPPGAFLDPLVAHQGSRALFERMIGIAIDTHHRLAGREAGMITLSVNVDRRDLEDPGFAKVLLARLAQEGIDPGAIMLEVTETTLALHVKALQRTLRTLAQAGVPVSLDDYGTGYASLADLQELPITEIKIDRRFIAGLGRSERSRKILHSSVQLADALGLSLVAEGIEDVLTARICRELGCAFGQGYAFARPMPREAFLHLMSDPQPRLSASDA